MAEPNERRPIYRALALTMALAALPIGAERPAVQPMSEQVAFQIDPGHGGRQSDPLLRPPLELRWAQELKTDGTNPIVSYPLIVDGMAFITSLIYGQASVIYGLDIATGETLWGPAEIGGSGHWSNAAYDAGRVFAVNNLGEVYAFDAGTGTLLWTTELNSDVSSAPVAAHGSVYVVSAGGLWAIDQDEGSIRWFRQFVDNSALTASPAVTDDAVFVSLVCHNVYAYSHGGRRLWRHVGDCFGGGGKTAVAYRGLLYVRDSASGGLILDTTTGEERGTFDSHPPPAFNGGTGYYLQTPSFACGSPWLDPCTLRAVDLATGQERWNFTGDGLLLTTPLVVDGVVYIGSSGGRVFGLDARTGRLLWRFNLRDTIPATDEHNASGPLTGWGAGSGFLMIPVFAQYQDFRLFAFGSA